MVHYETSSQSRFDHYKLNKDAEIVHFVFCEFTLENTLRYKCVKKAIYAHAYRTLFF